MTPKTIAKSDNRVDIRVSEFHLNRIFNVLASRRVEKHLIRYQKSIAITVLIR